MRISVKTRVNISDTVLSLAVGVLVAMVSLCGGCGKKDTTPGEKATLVKETEKQATKQGECPPGAVALVDERVITKEDAEKRARINLRQGGVNETDPDYEQKLKVARKGAVDILLRAYVMQAAATESVQVSSKEMEVELLAWKMRVPSQEAWQEFLAGNELNEEQFREILIKDIRIRKQMEKASTREVPTPSPEEARQFYDVNTLAFSWPYRIRYDEVRWIASAHLSQASREQARQGMDKLAIDLNKTPSLYDEILAKEVPLNTWGPIGFKLPYQPVKELPPMIQSTLQVLVQGEISPVIQTPDGFSLIRISSLSQTYDSAYLEILESIYSDRCRTNLEGWIKRQEQKHKIRICDVEYYRGEVVPATAEGVPQ
jgi:hypothetical protein